MQPRYLTGLMVLVAFSLGLPLVAQAVPVGRFVQVEGSVDLMKGGKFPAVPVKIQDGVEQGDAVRTKSLSKAQIQFVDDTVLTVAPESRVAIDEYVYDAAKSKRQATVEVFRGLVHFVVAKIFQTENPDFIMKTNTGVLGVRGTSFYAQLTALYTDIYNESGTTQVQNLFSEVPGKVTLTGMQYSRVGINVPPTVPMLFTTQDLQQLQIKFSTSSGTGGGSTSTGGVGTVSPLGTMAQGANPVTGPSGGTVPTTPSGTGGGSTSTGDSGIVSPLDTGALSANPASGPGGGTVPATFPTQNNLVNNPINNPAIAIFTQNPLVNNPIINPAIPPAPTPGPISGTYAFQMSMSGYTTITPNTSYSAIVNSSGWGLLTGVYPGYVTTSSSGTENSLSPIYTSLLTNIFNETFSGSVSGTQGQTLTGAFTAAATTSTGYTSSSASGTISIAPSGSATFSWNGALTNGTNTINVSKSGTSTPGTYFSQTAVGSVAQTDAAAVEYGFQTVTNLNGYPIWGTRTGVYPGQFSATINMASTAPMVGYYPPADQGSLTATMQGVVSGPAGGAQTGVMTTIASGQGPNSTPFTFAGPVTINPDGSLSASFWGTNTDNSVSPAPAGIFTQQGTWTQTAQAIPPASTYNFSIPLTNSDYISPTSTTQASVQSQGVGIRTGVYPGTYLDNVNSGTLTAPSAYFSAGINANTSVSGTLSGTVTGVVGGYNLTGTGTFTGTSATGQTLNYTGPITITPDGALTFNYTGTVTQAGQPTLTAAGTMTQYFALPVSQSASGPYQAVSGGSNPTLLNTSQMAGSQTINGVGPTPTNGSLALTYGPNSGLPAVVTGGSGTMSLNGSGAVFPWYGGQPTQGFLSSTVTVDTASVSQAGTYVTYDPTTGNLTGQVVSAPGSGAYVNGILATTPTGSGQTTSAFSESLTGGYQLTSNSPYNTASITNSGSLSGTMQMGGSGAVVAYPITANFNLTGTSQSGAFPASASGSVSVNNMIGAVVGPTNGTLTGLAFGFLNSSTSLGMNLIGPFTIDTNPSLPVGSSLPATLTLYQGNTSGTSPNGYPMTVSGAWNQVDPPLTGTATATATWAAAATGLTSPAQAWRLQRAAWLASPSAATVGAGADAPFLSGRFTRLTGTSLGSRIQGAAQLTHLGIPGNPALAANLQEIRRFRHLQRLTALRAVSGATPGGQSLGNPAGPILGLQRH